MNKTVLVDCDDVMLNYSYGFINYHKLPYPPSPEKEYRDLFAYIHEEYKNHDERVMQQMVEDFNNSYQFSQLEPLKESVQWMKKLKDEGYEFILISKAGASDDIFDKRMENLDSVFGSGFFTDVFLIDLYDSKYRYLKQFENSDFCWIEDNIENYYMGEALGLKSILLKTQFNADRKNHELSTANDWEEIYYRIRNWYE